MKTLFFLMTTLLVAIPTSAQKNKNTKGESDDAISLSIDSAYYACIAMQQAIEKSDTAALRKASLKLKAQDPSVLASLHKTDGTTDSLTGHFVFSSDFADSLLTDESAYAHADNIDKSTRQRGVNRGSASHNKSLFMRSLKVKAGSTVTYTFHPSGYQELAFVTEPRGKVVIRVHATNKSANLDIWRNDTKNNRTGARRFRTCMDLPQKPNSTVEIEIKNITTMDTSLVVISN